MRLLPESFDTTNRATVQRLLNSYKQLFINNVYVYI
jgi:hypothetical protein